MLITNEIFQAFLNCELKSYLKLSGAVASQREFTDWQQHLAEDYKQKCATRLRAGFAENECLFGIPFQRDLENNEYRLVIGCTVQAEGLQSQIHALERLDFSGK